MSELGAKSEGGSEKVEKEAECYSSEEGRGVEVYPQLQDEEEIQGEFISVGVCAMDAKVSS